MLQEEQVTRATIERKFAVASALGSEQLATEQKGRKHGGHPGQVLERGVD
jgi:hypothetical protein